MLFPLKSPSSSPSLKIRSLLEVFVVVLPSAVSAVTLKSLASTVSPINSLGKVTVTILPAPFE